MNEVQALLAAVPPGPVTGLTGLDALLAGCWDTFDGPDGGGMEGQKLLGRMENVAWTPPVLSLVVERHGRTVCGSTRAELQHWAVDFDAMTATNTKNGHRQLEPMAPRLSIKAIAEEVAQAIIEGKEDNRLKRLDDNTVEVQASSIFPTGSGFTRTVEGRRETLARYIEETLTAHCWVMKGRNVFTRTEAQPVDAAVMEAT
jgi:hypothetical protein